MTTPLDEESPIHACPSCRAPLKRKSGKMGPFWGCSAFPECKTTLNDIDGKPSTEVNESYRCPMCTRRLILSESGYWFCSGYKKGCKVQLADIEGTPETVNRCRECGNLLVKREGKNGSFWGCSDYPKCSRTYSDGANGPKY